MTMKILLGSKNSSKYQALKESLEELEIENYEILCLMQNLM